jgi:glycosyltransferase involved in cell wall biosynthesis
MAVAALVSVVTATYNTAPYLEQAIASILAQDYPAWELIIVDDGSTDDTGAILDRYANDPRITVIRQPNRGQAAAKNRGIAAAQGRYVGFCDADDAWLPDKLTRQVPCFDAAGRIGVVYGESLWIDAQGRPLPAIPMRRHSGRVTAELLVDNFVPFPTALIRRDVLQEAGGFDETLSMAIDNDLWLRISIRHEFLHLPVPLAYYRIWPGQMSHRTGERLDNFFRIFANFLRDHPGCVARSDLRRAWAHTYVTRGRWHAREGRALAAWRDYLTALGHRPHDRRLWKQMAKLLLARFVQAGP